MMRRFSVAMGKWVLLPLTAIAVLAGTTLYWLVATEPGSAWFVSRAIERTGLRIHIGNISGTLSHGLTLEELSIPFSEQTVTASGVEIRQLRGHWDLLSVLGGQFAVRDLALEGIDLYLPQSSNSDTEAPAGWPQITSPFPVSIGNFTMNALAVHRGGEQTGEVRSASFSALLSPRELHIRALNVILPDGELSVSGRVRSRYPYTLKLESTWRLTAREQDWQGQLRLTGPVTAMTLEHRLQTPFVLNTQGTLAVASTSAAMPQSADAVSVDLANSWDQITLPLDAENLGTSGLLTAQGTIDSYEINLQSTLTKIDENLSPATGEDASIQDSLATVTAGLFPAQLIARTTGNRHQLTDATLALSTDRGQASAQGQVSWGDAVRWQLNVAASNLDLSALAAMAPDDLSASLTSSGQWTDQTLDAEVTLSGLAGQLGGQPLAGNGEVSIHNDSYEVNGLVLRVGDNEIKAHGRIDGDTWTQNTLDWQVNLPNIAFLGPEYAGSLTSQGTWSGSLAAPTVDATATARNLRARDWLADSVDIKAQSSRREAFSVTLSAAGLSGPGLDNAALEFSGRGTAAQHSLDAALSSSDLSLEIAATGAYADSGWRGAFKQASVNSVYAGTWTLQRPASASVAPGQFSVAPLCLLKDAASLCGSLSLQANTLKAQAALSEFELAELERWLPPGTRLQGTANGQLQLGGKLPNSNSDAQGLKGSLQLHTSNGEVAYNTGDNGVISHDLALSASAEAVDNAFNAQATLSLNDTASTSLKLRAGLDRDSPLNGELDVEIHSLEWVQAFAKGVEKPTGSLSGKAEVAGTLFAPRLNGQLNLVEIAATVPAAGIRLEHGNGALTFRSGEQWRLDANLESDSGVVQVRGEGPFWASGDQAAYLDISGENVQLVNLPDTRLRVSPDLRLSRSEDGIKVKGKLGVPHADITIRQLPEGATRVSADEVQIPPRKTRRNTLPMTTDLEVELGDDVNIKGYGFAAGLRGKLKVNAKNGELPVAKGNVRLIDGTYEAYGQQLEVSRGVLIFQGAIDNPGLNITAVRDTPTARVGLRIGGFAQDIRSEIFSEPALPPTDALIILVTGKPPSDINQSEANQVMNAATALGVSQSEWITSRLQSAFGVDVLALESGDTYQESTLVVGKYLTPKLFVSYIQNLFSPQGAFAMQYQIGKRLGLKAQSGETQSIDVLFRIEH